MKQSGTSYNSICSIAIVGLVSGYMSTGCAFGNKSNEAMSPGNSAPQPSQPQPVLPPVQVTGAYLTSVLTDNEGVPLADVEITVVLDEDKSQQGQALMAKFSLTGTVTQVGTRKFYRTRTNHLGEFSMPTSFVRETKIDIDVSLEGKIVPLSVTLPQAIVTAIQENQIISDADLRIDSVLAVRLPENYAEIAVAPDTLNVTRYPPVVLALPSQVLGKNIAELPVSKFAVTSHQNNDSITSEFILSGTCAPTYLITLGLEYHTPRVVICSSTGDFSFKVNLPGPSGLKFAEIRQDDSSGGNHATLNLALHKDATYFGWRQEAYIKAPNAGADDQFGISLSLSGDMLAVGANQEDSNLNTITPLISSSFESNDSEPNAGAVYIFRRAGVTWSASAYVKAFNSDSDDQFGTSVSLSGDMLAVGAPNEDSDLLGIHSVVLPNNLPGTNESEQDTGAVYVYRKTANAWTLDAFLKSLTPTATQNFGSTLSLEGNTLAVSTETGASNPETTVTRFVRGPSTWEPAGSAQYIGYHSSVVSTIGDTLAVGLPSDDYVLGGIFTEFPNTNWSVGQDSGAVAVYRHDNTSDWTREAYIKASNAEDFDKFGTSVTLSGDTMAVGAVLEDSNQTTITNGPLSSANNDAENSGAVYIYRRSGTTWTQEAYIKAANARSGHNFGASVSIANNTLAIGANWEDSNQTTITNGPGGSADTDLTNSGAVYVYRRLGSIWTHEAYIKASNSNSWDHFGRPVHLSGDTLAVAANQEASNQTTITNGTSASTDNSFSAAGAVYIFRNYGRMFDPDVRISATQTNSITLSWHANLGSTETAILAPANSGTSTPAACSHPDAIRLPPGMTSHTFTGLQPATKYGFRVCAHDSTGESAGSLIWANTK